jgi:FtsZ-interacting cell division protein YlmF
MGAVHALDGELQRIDRDTVVLLPYGVDEDIDLDEIDEEIVEEDDSDDDSEDDSEDLD